MEYRKYDEHHDNCMLKQMEKFNNKCYPMKEVIAVQSGTYAQINYPLFIQ